MNIDEIPEDSDTSDEDYVPGSANQDNIPSEAESEGDSEDQLSETEETDTRRKKRKKGTIKTNKNFKSDVPESGSDTKETKTDEEKKKKGDDLWADFMKDTGFKPKNSNTEQTIVNGSKSKTEKVPETNTPPKDIVTHKHSEKVKVTQIFEFAGEEVKVEKEVPVDSAEVRLIGKTASAESSKSCKGKRSGGLSGISNVLSQLGKKPKISTLEKSKLDWDQFKREENIEEELQVHNKGKAGYLERQDFLQRADQRRFEIERNLREIERNKRFNSAP